MQPLKQLIPLFMLIGLVTVSFTENKSALAKSDSPQSKLYPKSYALVIGVNQAGGDWSPLSSAEDDANTFADHLERRGFDVIRLFGKQANKMGILKQLQTVLPQKVSEDDRFIFYFAGHGQTQKTANGKKVGYIVPADGAILNDENQWHTYLSMRELKSLLTEHIPSKHTLLLFDSCFSGLMFTRGGLRRSSLGAKAHLSKKGVMALTAGASGELALDGLFTPTLIQALSGEADENMDGITSFQEVALYTRREVQARRDQQTPQFGILTGSGQMIFESKVPTQKFSQSTFKAKAAQLEVERSVSAGSSDLPWGVVALSGAALSAVGIGLVSSSLYQVNSIKSETDNELYNRRVENEFGQLSSQYTAGWILGGIGVSALVWGLYEKMGNDRDHRDESAHHSSQDQKSHLSVYPIIAPQHAGVAVSW